MNFRKILLAVFALVVFPTIVLAQETVNKLEPVDCFADGLYQFQSVQVSVGPENDTYKAGETIKFTGEIINENRYPVVDGNIFVRVSKVNSDTENVDTIWHDVVDEFIALEGVSLDGANSQVTNFTWTSPASLGSGDYRADYFFTVDKRFNLGGLPFSNEISIGTAYFAIENSSLTSFKLDRENTKVNNVVYQHVGDWPRVEPDSKVTFTQPLKNLSNKDLTFDVSYDLYYWDSLRKEDKIDSKSEKINVSANKSVDLSYVIDSVKEPVYYLKITTKSGDLSSIVNLRVTSDIAKMRLNYPAVNNFPILKGEETTLFSCFHMTSGAVENGKLVLTLTDKKDNVLATGEYSGEIGSMMDAAATKFIANDNYEIVKLKAVLLNSKGAVVDQYETTYDCSKIGGEQCRLLNQAKANSAFNYMEIGYILLITLVALLIIVRIKNMKGNSQLKKAMFAVLVVLLLLLVALVVKTVVVGTDVREVGAQSATFNGSKTRTGTKTGSYSITGFSGDRKITNGDLNLKHTVNLVVPDTAKKIADGSWWIKKGSNFSLTNSTECYFHSKGGAWDTPTCGPAQYFPNANSSRYGYVQFGSYTEPNKVTISTVPERISCSGMNCTANELGCSDIRVQVDGISKKPRACATWGNKTGSGVACTSENLSVGPLTWDGRSQKIFLNAVGATVNSYVTEPWRVCVYDDAECGTANRTIVSAQPTGAAACSENSTYNEIPDDTSEEFRWSCMNKNSIGASASCTAIKMASCGSASGTTVSALPTGTAACAIGTQASGLPDSTTQFKWDCVSQKNNQALVHCTANKTVPLCGSAQGTTVSVLPTGTAACQTGSNYVATPEDTTTQFKWSCSVTGGTTVTNCFANKTTDGKCGTSNGTNLPQPYPLTTTAACVDPTTARDVTDTTTQFKWDCVSPNGGTTDHCSSNRVAGLSCGTASTAVGTTFSTPPTGTQACIPGESNISNRSETANKYYWTCSNGGETRNCEANRQLPVVVDLGVTCSVTDPTIKVGSTVTFNAAATGGAGGYTYRWSGDVSGTTDTITRTFATKGSYSAVVTARDSVGQSAVRTCPTIVVSESSCCGDNGNPVNSTPVEVEIYYGAPGTPAIVSKPEEKCTVGWEIESSSTGTCVIENARHDTTPVGDYLNDVSKTFQTEVFPQNLYNVICTDDMPNPDGSSNVWTSATLNCVLNPNLIEQ